MASAYDRQEGGAGKITLEKVPFAGIMRACGGPVWIRWEDDLLRRVRDARKGGAPIVFKRPARRRMLGYALDRRWMAVYCSDWPEPLVHEDDKRWLDAMISLMRDDDATAGGESA